MKEIDNILNPSFMKDGHMNGHMSYDLYSELYFRLELRATVLPDFYLLFKTISL